LLRLAGAVPIIAVDPLPAARQRALQFGADLALDSADPELADTVRRETGGHGLAAAFDFAGVPPVRDQAVRCLGPAGRLVLVGMTDKPLTITDGTTFSHFQQQVRGHYGSAPEHVLQLAELLNRQRWRTRVELANAIFEYIEGFHNRRRRHSALGWASPLEFETEHRHQATTPHEPLR
jgi:threonine dehydrogenase-like Zn-dependent dehydrogenase